MKRRTDVERKAKIGLALFTFGMLGAIGNPATAQLVSSWDAPLFDDGVSVDRTNSWVTDVATGDFRGLEGFPTVRAMAADNQLDRLYVSGGRSITTFGLDQNGDLEDLGSSPRVQNLNDRAAESGQVVGLGFAKGVLYASVSRRLGDEQRNRGIERGFYSIDPVTGEAILLRTDSEIDLFVGMDYSPEDDLMYAVIGPVNGQSIVAFDLETFTVVQVASIPLSVYGGGVGTFDGVAVSESTVYLTSGRDTLPIAVFDLDSETFGPSLPNPPRFGENTSYPGGSTFLRALGEPVPEPSFAAGLAIGALTLTTKRNKARRSAATQRA